MQEIIVNDYVDATLCALFMAVVAATALFGIAAARKALATPAPTCREEPVAEVRLMAVKVRHA